MCKNDFWRICLQWEIACHPLQWDELPQALSWQLQGHTILSVTYTEKIGKKKSIFQPCSSQRKAVFPAPWKVWALLRL